MKKMIRMAVLAAAMCVTVTTVSKAQDQQGRGGGRGAGGGRGGVAALLQGITLDSVTNAKIQEIAQKYQAQQRDMMQGGQPDMAKMQELQTKRNDEIKALLNADQKKTFDENVAKAPQGRRGPPPSAK